MKVSKQKEDNIIIITSNAKLQPKNVFLDTIHDQIRDTLQPANCSFLIDIRLLALPNSIKASTAQCWKINLSLNIGTFRFTLL